MRLLLLYLFLASKIVDGQLGNKQQYQNKHLRAVKDKNFDSSIEVVPGHIINKRKLIENEKGVRVQMSDMDDDNIILTSDIIIEISFIPGQMNSSQKHMFEQKLKTFLHEKVDLSSSHTFSVDRVDVVRETFTKAEEDMVTLQENGLFALLAEIIIQGKLQKLTTPDSSPPDMELFHELTLEAVQNHEEFLARDVNHLSREDSFFQHVYEISLSSIFHDEDSNEIESLSHSSDSEKDLGTSFSEIDLTEIMDSKHNEQNNNKGVPLIERPPTLINESIEIEQQQLSETEYAEIEEIIENEKSMFKVINLVAIAAIGMGSFGLFGILLSGIYYLK